jgi:allophanate hydrolase
MSRTSLRAPEKLAPTLPYLFALNSHLGAAMRGWTIGKWLDAYRSGDMSPATAMAELAGLIAASEPEMWTLRLDAAALEKQVDALESRWGGRAPQLPLYGVPFAVKDNIDVAGLPTTAACPDFAYQAEHTAHAVQRLLDAGAILVGKTNLDQFATGLVGTRSPYGAVRNSFNPDYISGGSSSGSATVVAHGLVPFTLGTDTAGSGRIPAAFNNLVGLKPTRGNVSTDGVVPACRSLDCVSVFALDPGDAGLVYTLLDDFDTKDAHARAAPALRCNSLPARPRFGVPASPAWFGDALAEAHWRQTLSDLGEIAELVPIDFSPFHEAAALLYQGPWLAERYITIEPLLRRDPDSLMPIIREIVAPAASMTAVESFRALYRLAELKRQTDTLMAQVDALLVPSAPGIYTREEVAGEPVKLNNQLGTYTNFVNLLDLCALALPAGLREDGLPAGITLIAPAWHDRALLEFGHRWQCAAPWSAGATGEPLPAATPETPEYTDSDGQVTVAVVGAHLSGMPLNHQLTDRGAVLVETTRTADCYRLYALDTSPPKPGLVKQPDGAAIELELWQMSAAGFGDFVTLVPPPLCIGTLTLEDGRQVRGFLCEHHAADSAEDITDTGGWRAYMKTIDPVSS